MSFFKHEQIGNDSAPEHSVLRLPVTLLAALALTMCGASFAADNDSDQNQAAEESSQATQDNGNSQDDNGQAEDSQRAASNDDSSEADSSDQSNAAANDDSQDENDNADGNAAAESQGDNNEAADNASDASSEDIVEEQSSATLLASKIIGKSVRNGTGDDAEDVGEITDLVLDEDQQTVTVLVGVGGFLGIGQKQVGVSLDQVEFNGEDNPAVINMTRDELEDAPAYKTLTEQQQQQRQKKQQQQMQQQQQQQAPATGGGMGG